MHIHVNYIDISANVGNWQDIQLTQVLTKEVSKLQFNIKIYGSRFLNIPKLGDRVDMYVDGNAYHYFGGTVTEVEITNLGGKLLVAAVTATDWSFKMDTKLVAKTYAGIDPADIVKDIVNNYTDGTYTTNNVDHGNFLIPSIKFNYEPVTKCIQKLATLIGWDWNVDANKDVHFFLVESNPAPFSIDDTTGNLEWPTLDWDQDLTNMKNSVYVIGANYKKTYTVSTTPDVYTSVAGTLVYPLAYTYDRATMTVTLSGVSQTVGIDQSTPDANCQVQYNDKGRFIRFIANPGVGNSIKIYGDALIPILAHASDPAAIAIYGEIQDSIVDKQITSVTEAQLRATAEIDMYGHAVNTLKFTTLQAGLFAGMQITFNSPTFQAIYGTSSLSLTIRRITAVGYSPYQLEYQVECYGSDQVSFVDIMSLLLQQENSQNPVDDSTIVETIESYLESITVSEAVSISGGATKTYKWDGTDKWGFSVWQ